MGLYSNGFIIGTFPYIAVLQTVVPFVHLHTSFDFESSVSILVTTPLRSF